MLLEIKSFLCWIKLFWSELERVHKFSCLMSDVYFIFVENIFLHNHWTSWSWMLEFLQLIKGFRCRLWAQSLKKAAAQYSFLNSRAFHSQGREGIFKFDKLICNFVVRIRKTNWVNNDSAVPLCSLTSALRLKWRNGFRTYTSLNTSCPFCFLFLKTACVDASESHTLTLFSCSEYTYNLCSESSSCKGKLNE